MMRQEDFDEFFTNIPLYDNREHTVIVSGWKKNTVQFRDETRTVLHFDVIAFDGRPVTSKMSWDTRSVKTIGKLMPAILEAQENKCNALHFKITRKMDNSYIINDIVILKANTTGDGS